MALSLPKKIVVEATNETGTTLVKGYVVQIIATRTSADGNLVYQAYRFDRGVSAGSTVLDQLVPTVGVLESLSLDDGDSGSFCIAGETVAYCDGDGSDIDDEAYLFLADDNIAAATAFTLTNNATSSSENDGTANVAVGGTLLGAGTSGEELVTILTALRGRTVDPFGGAAGDGDALVASGAQGNVKIVLFNNPPGIVG
jgi:hypothetical protein